MLEINDLWVNIDDKEVLQGINLRVPVGETHILFGKNGSGKSSLLMAIMGFERYAVKRGHQYSCHSERSLAEWRISAAI